MDTQTINTPVLNNVYQFNTVRLAGSSYRIENRTPYTLYVVNKSAASAQDVKTQAQITVLPMNAANLSYVDGLYISCVLSADIAQISLPQDVQTFIKFTTFLQTETAQEQQTNSAIASYNPASLEINAIPASEAIQNPPPNTQIFLPSTPVDLFGWNGAYFTFDCDHTLQDSIYGFVQQSDDPTFTTSSTIRYFAGATGLIYIPRFLRYLRVSCVTSPEWAGGNLETSLRRTVAEIQPSIQYRQNTFSFRKDYAVGAGVSRGFYIPIIPPVSRVSIINNNANRLVMNRNGLTLDGQSTDNLDVWVIRPSRINTFYVEAGVAFFLNLVNDAIGSNWSCRIISTYGNQPF